MTAPHWHRMVALVSLTVTAAVKIVYTRAVCPHCGKLLWLVPGKRVIVRRKLERVVDGEGEGRVVSCPRCPALLEVVERVA